MSRCSASDVNPRVAHSFVSECGGILIQNIYLHSGKRSTARECYFFERGVLFVIKHVVDTPYMILHLTAKEMLVDRPGQLRFYPTH